MKIEEMDTDDILDTVSAKVKNFNDALYGQCLVRIVEIGEKSIPALREQLHDSKEVIRDFCRDALTRLGDENIIPDLLAFMTSPFERDRLGSPLNLLDFYEMGVLSLADLKSFILLLRALISLSINFQDRSVAVRALAQAANDDETYEVLKAHLPFETHEMVRIKIQSLLDKIENSRH